MDVPDSFAELERDDLACDCGCGRHWLVSRGQLRHAGAVTSFVAIPTWHGDERVAWLGLGAGAEPAHWSCVRSWLQGDDIAAGIVDPDETPIRRVLDAARLLPREAALADKARIFAVHDQLTEHHEDLRHVFFPDHGRDFSFKLPDCVFALPQEQRSPVTSENFAEHDERFFVRALLPIPIADGTELRVGVWIEVEHAAFFALAAVFWDDEAAYMTQRLTGPIENALVVGGFDVRGARVTMAARTPDRCLFVTGAETPRLAEILRAQVPASALRALVREIEASVRPHAKA